MSINRAVQAASARYGSVVQMRLEPSVARKLHMQGAVQGANDAELLRQWLGVAADKRQDDRETEIQGIIEVQVSSRYTINWQPKQLFTVYQWPKLHTSGPTRPATCCRSTMKPII